MQLHGTGRFLSPTIAKSPVAPTPGARRSTITKSMTPRGLRPAATQDAHEGDYFIVNGEKTYISNAPFADHYVVVARTGEAPGAKGLSAFVVDAHTPGLTCGEPIELIAPHPVGPLSFVDCRVPRS